MFGSSTAIPHNPAHMAHSNAGVCAPVRPLTGIRKFVSAAVAFQPHVTICPPGPERPELTIARFDRVKVSGRYPVSAQFNGEDFSSTGLAFEDYSRMYTQHRKQSAERRLPTPSWALNPAQLRSLLVYYTERRAGFREPQPGTEKERLERASLVLNSLAERIEAILRNLCGEYLALNKSGENPERLKKVKSEIQNHDTQLRVNRNVAAIVLQVVHLYFSVGLDSVGVGTELGLKPPHVRMLLLRMHEAWARMNIWRGPRMCINVLRDWVAPAKEERAHAPKEKPATPPKIHRVRTSEPPKAAYIRIRKIDVAIAAQMRDAGKTYEEIGQFFGAHQTSIHGALKKAGMWKRPAPRFKIDVDLLTRLFHESRSTTEMGNVLGIPIEMVRYYLRRLGLVRLRPKVDIEIAARMFAAGATYADIAKTLRLPNETAVARALKRNGAWKPHRNISVDLDLIARLFNEGKTQIEIQNILGISRGIVRLRLERLGLWRGRGRCKRRSKVDRGIAAKMFADGQSYRQMANFFGVTSPAIAYALKQHGCWHPRAVTHK
jgi:hypothetical protein